MTLIELEERLAQVLPDTISMCCNDPRDAPDGLWPEEARHVERAVDKRQREFAAGRRAARHALQALGYANSPLLAAKNRVPIWPKGATGSISHCADRCVALATKEDNFQSVGVDIECASPLKVDLVREVCTEHEMREVVEVSDMPLVCAKRIFSAKEAAFKAQFMLSGKLLGFGRLEIDFPTPDRFSARFRKPEDSFEVDFTFEGVSMKLADHFVHIMMIT